MRSLAITAAFGCLLVAEPVLAQNEAAPPTLEQQEADESAHRFHSLTDKLIGLVEEMAARKEGQCMKAFGHAQFCKCIADHSPMAVDFVGYVRIVGMTKAELDYDLLSSENKELVDLVRASREKCVGAEPQR